MFSISILITSIAEVRVLMTNRRRMGWGHASYSAGLGPRLLLSRAGATPPTEQGWGHASCWAGATPPTEQGWGHAFF
ncbi:unnamed protein product [Boreogadus saida]